MIRWLPRSSALSRSQQPDSWQWGLAEHLLAGVFDVLQGANWQRGGNPNAPRPEPLARPGVGDDDDVRPAASTVDGSAIRDELARRRAAHAARQPKIIRDRA